MAPTDVIVSGSDRRRLPPRWVLRSIAALAAVVVGTIVSINQYDANHARDLAYARAVHLTTVSDVLDVANATGAPVHLLNIGTVDVTVLSAVIERAGYAADTRRQPLPAGASVVVRVPYPTCSPAVLTAPPDSMVVNLIAHGIHVRDVIDLSPDAYANLDRTIRARCGYLPAEEAFGYNVTSTVVRGQQVIVHLHVFDDSVLPLTLDRIVPPPGLGVATSPALPLVLPVQTEVGSTPTGLDTVLTYTVTSCRTFLRTGSVGSAWIVRDATLHAVLLRLRPVDIALGDICQPGLGFGEGAPPGG